MGYSVKLLLENSTFQQINRVNKFSQTKIINSLTRTVGCGLVRYSAININPESPMKSSMKKVLVVACVALVMCASSAIRLMADTIAFNENATPSSTPAATGLVGFEFTVNQNIDVTKLGFYGQSIGGGDTPQVSLWNVASGFGGPSPLATTGSLQGNVPNEPGWNYYSITPQLLTVGNTYAVTAPIYFSEQYNSTTTFTYGSAIATPTYLLDPGFGGWANSDYTFASLSATSPGANISANFQYTLAAVPEPSTYLMLGAGFAVLLVMLRRRAAKTTL
jgi:PEP-CTERM motif-containing protein